jgi:CRP-like cAMP-binding protein
VKPDFESPFFGLEGEWQEFKTGDIFGIPGEKIDKVFVLREGLLCSLVQLSGGDQVETGMVGPSGIIGACVVANACWANHFIAQSSGTAWAIPAEAFLRAISHDETLHRIAVASMDWLLVQAQQAAACNARHSLKPRLCTWLLRGRDLTGLDELPLTQELLARIVGSRRPSISVIATELTTARLIQRRRGKVAVRDPERMAQTACECYPTVRARYRQIFES